MCVCVSFSFKSQALAAFAALFAGLVTGFISDKIGRKPSMLLGCLPLVIGWSIIAISYVFTKDPDYRKFYSMLMVGRGLSGFGIGCLSLVVPVSSTVCGKKVVLSAPRIFVIHP